MTGKETRIFFENLVDDDHDITHVYQILSNSKNKIERKYKLAILESQDATQTRNVSDNYLNMKDLASDFRSMLKLYVGTQMYSPISFRDRILFKDAALRYYIDYKNSKLGITGVAGKAETITQIYLAKTTDYTEDNEADTILTWPSDLHALPAYDAAGIFQGNIDPDDLAFRASERQIREANEMLDAFIDWDHDLKLQQQDDSLGFEPEGSSLEEDLAYM